MPAVAETLDTVQSVTQSGYKWGFETNIEMEIAPKGLNEDTIRLISSKKDEPEWLLEWRLQAFEAWQTVAKRKAGPLFRPAHRRARTKPSNCAMATRSAFWARAC